MDSPVLSVGRTTSSLCSFFAFKEEEDGDDKETESEEEDRDDAEIGGCNAFVLDSAADTIWLSDWRLSFRFLLVW